MACLYCGNEIPPIRRLQDADFCSPAHRRQYHSRLRTGLHRLVEAEPHSSRPAGFMHSMAPVDAERALRPVTAGLQHPAEPPYGPGAFNVRPAPMLGRSFAISPRVQPQAGAPPACSRVRAEARPVTSRGAGEIARRRLFVHIGLPSLPRTGGSLGSAELPHVEPLPPAASGNSEPLQQAAAWKAFPLELDAPALTLSCKADGYLAGGPLCDSLVALPPCVRPADAAPAPAGMLVPARLAERVPDVPGWAGTPAASLLLRTAGTTWRPRAAAPNGSHPLPAPAPAGTAPAVAVPEFAPPTARPALPPQPAAAFPLHAPEIAAAWLEPQPARLPARDLRLPACKEIAAPRLSGREVFYRLRVQAREFASREPVRAGSIAVLASPPTARFGLAVPAAAPAVPGPAAAAAAAGRLPGAASLPTAPAPAPAVLQLSPAALAVRPLRFILTLDPGGRLETFAASTPAPVSPCDAAPARGTPAALEMASPALLPILPREMGPNREPAAAPFAGRPPASAVPVSREVALGAEAVPLILPAVIPPLPGHASAPEMAAIAKPLRLPLKWREAPAAFTRRGEFPPVAPGPRLPKFDIPAVLESLSSIDAQPEPERLIGGLLAVMPDRAARRRRAHVMAQRILAAAAGILAAVAFWSSGAPMTAGRALASLNWVGQSLADRASVEHSDDFRGGMKDWQGASENWARSWSYHPDGYMRPGQFAIFRPSLAHPDYRLQMLAQIERAGLSCAVRARDPENYYAVKLTVMKPGPRPLVSLVRYPVIGGKKGKPVEVPVRATLHHNAPYRLAVEVHGRTFAASVEGQQVDRWTDDALSSGGVGMFSDAGERARLYWVKVTSNDDLLGRICAMLVRRDANRHAWEHRRYSPVPALVFFPGSPQ